MLSALVTGGGAGIGRAACIALAAVGYRVTVADIKLASAVETCQECGGHAEVLAHACDVTKKADLESLMKAHLDRWGTLDLAINNAGVGNAPNQEVIDINLLAIINATALQIKCMAKQPKGGVIINVASIGALLPMAASPVYAASKAGCLMYSRSVAERLEAADPNPKIRVASFCPAVVDTKLAEALPIPVNPSFSKISPQTAGEALVRLAHTKRNNGAVLRIFQDGTLKLWQAPPGQASPPSAAPSSEPLTLAELPNSARSKPVSASPPKSASQVALPASFRRMVVHTLGTDFGKNTRIETVPMPTTLPRGQALVRVRYAGINASDVNYSAGRYHSSPKAAAEALPFICGFEAVGEVVGLSEGTKGPPMGSPVALLQYGAFAEYMVVPAKVLMPIPAQVPEAIAMLTSGLTASIGLEQAGNIKKGETVLVTAAAGGTGIFAVQLAKLAGCTVIATCGSDEKASLLKSLGADHVINYRKQDLRAELKALPRLDVVYESVGGDMFETASRRLAVGGRLVVIGMMSQYTEGEGGTWAPSKHVGLSERLLSQSATVVGFFLLHYAKHFGRHFKTLATLQAQGKLIVPLDGYHTQHAGLDSVVNAVQRLQSGKSMGKVCVTIDSNPIPPQARL